MEHLQPTTVAQFRGSHAQTANLGGDLEVPVHLAVVLSAKLIVRTKYRADDIGSEVDVKTSRTRDCLIKSIYPLDIIDTAELKAVVLEADFSGFVGGVQDARLGCVACVAVLKDRLMVIRGSQ